MRIARQLAGLRPRSLAFVVFAAVFGGASISIAHLYRMAIAQKDEAVRHHVRDLTIAAAGLVDVTRHEELTARTQFQSEEHRRLLAPLLQFHRRHSSIQYLWTVRVTASGGQMFVLETSIDPTIRAQQQQIGRSQDLLEFLGPNTETPLGERSIPSLRAGNPVVFSEIYRDVHGTYIEARAPLQDGEGRFVGYLGIDYALDSYTRQIGKVHVAGAITLALALLVGAVLAQASYYMRRESLADLAAVETQRRLAEQANAAKSEFLAIASHDLKNPLSAIAGMSGLLLQMKKAAPDQAAMRDDIETLDTIHASARHMSEIVRGILVTEGIEQGGLPFNPAPTDLAALCREVIKFNAPAAAKKRVTLQAELPPPCRRSPTPSCSGRRSTTT